MSCGIYQIWIDDKYYFGSSNNIEWRLSQHKSALKNNKHENIKMQRCFNKYNRFDYDIIVTCDEQSRLKWEQSFIDEHYGLDNCMNLAKDANKPPSPFGREVKKETREKISNRQRGSGNSASRKVEFNGTIFNTMKELAEHLNISQQLLDYKIKNGIIKAHRRY